MGGSLLFTYKLVYFSKFLIKMRKDCVKIKNFNALPINNYYSHSNLIFKREYLFKKYSNLHDF